MSITAAVENENKKVHPAPEIGDILFFFIALIPLMLKPNFVFGDGDTAWHLVTGEYILNNLRVPTQDLFCYLATSPDPKNPEKLWVAYQWLSDVIMAILVRLGGLNLLAVCVSCVIGLLFLMLYDRCRKEGAHFFFVVFLCLAGALVSAVHWLARPHLFTFFGVLIFASTLEDFYRQTISQKKLLLTLCLTMAVWVNCHPAFFFGFAIIAIYLFSALISAAYFAPGAKRSGYLHNAKGLALALLATVAASFINPYGIALYKYISNYLRTSGAILNATDEFLSPIFHLTLQPTCLEILFALFIVGLAISQKRLSLPRLLCCIAFCHLSLSAVRNMPLLVVIILPAIAQLFSKVRLPGEYRSPRLAVVGESTPEPVDSDSSQPAKWWQTLVKYWDHVGRGIDDEEWRCKMHLLPIGMFLFFAVVSLHPLDGKLFGTDIVASGFDPENKPTETIEVLRKLENEGKLLSDKGFNYDNWGGYINYKLGTKVFIDDRADYYGEQFYARYSIINQVIPGSGKASGWTDWLKHYDIQWALIPKDSRLAQALQSTLAWKVAAQDKASLLLVRPDKDLSNDSKPRSDTTSDNKLTPR